MSTTPQFKKNNPFSFITPTKKPQHPKHLITSASNLWSLRQFDQTELLAVDIETKGTQMANPDCRVIGLSISNRHRAVYFDKRVIAPHKWTRLIDWLLGCERLVAHNTIFDAGFLYVEAGHRWMNWKWCTHGMARQLCGEGFPGQRWGLKWLQTEAMLWPETNEKELDEWLVINGHYTGTIKKEDNNPKGRLHTFRHVRNKTGRRVIGPDKSEMWRAPPTILGKYCCLDSFSTLMLWDVFDEALKRNLGPVGQTEYEKYHTTFMTSVRLHVSQQLCGIHTDPAKHLQTERRLEEEVTKLEKEFLFHPEVATHIHAYNQSMLDEKKVKKPNKFKKLPTLSSEPDTHTKAGQPSKNWAKWNERRQMIERLGEGEVNKNWVVWDAKYTEMEQEAKAHALFNPGSDKQLIWLFHEQLGKPIVKKTDSGEPSTDEEAKLQWGEPGRLLIKADILRKRITFVKGAYLAAGECGDDVIHMQVKMPGTVTCRLAGGGSSKGKKDISFNVQNQPKDREHLENFKPPPGHVLVGRDWDSMEDKVLFELTRDKGLNQLYGPSAPKGNCAYIWVGSQLPVIGQEFLDAGYDPDNPQADVVKRIKKELKETRGIAKVIKLGKNYGMGAKLFCNNMKMQGIDIPLDDAYKLMDGLNEVFPDAYLRFPEELKEEWMANGGWFLNGLGQPVSVSHTCLKDLVNRCVQRTAHDIHQKSIELVEEVAKEKGWTMMWTPDSLGNEKFARPFILDLHDEGMWAIKEHSTEEFSQVIREADERLNDWLGGHIKMTGEPEVARSLADFKVED